jgi:hypothetical protein
MVINFPVMKFAERFPRQHNIDMDQKPLFWETNMKSAYHGLLDYDAVWPGD